MSNLSSVRDYLKSFVAEIRPKFSCRSTADYYSRHVGLGNLSSIAPESP
jgi:hypothetical protein